MVDIEPGMYISSQRVAFMNGFIEYFELSNSHRTSCYQCRHTDHKEFMENGWAYLGPSEVCKW